MSDDKSNVILKLVMPDGTVRDITMPELVLTNNLAQEALVRLLIEKGLFKPEEFDQMLKDVQKERYHFAKPDEPSN